MKKRGLLKGFILESAQIVVIFLLVFLIIYFFIGQLLEVTGDSMYPFFQDKEQIVAEKISVNISNNLKRGDIVIFKHPLENSRLLIKRIIGLPGETLTLSDGYIFIDGERLYESYLTEDVETRGQRAIQETEDYQIPNNAYVVMGDNRDKSTDSREWGYVQKDYIVGKGILVYYPLNKIRIIKDADF